MRISYFRNKIRIGNALFHNIRLKIICKDKHAIATVLIANHFMICLDQPQEKDKTFFLYYESFFLLFLRITLLEGSTMVYNVVFTT